MAGQKCTATSRLLVQEQLMPDVLAQLEQRLAGLVAADPRRDGTFTGPVINNRSRDRLLDLVAQAAAAGARVMAAPASGSRPPGGAFVDPTVIVAPHPTSTVVTDEVFGPVMTVEPFRELEDAIDMVNGTRYGLVSSIYTAGSGMSFMEAVDCGTVLVNQPTTGLDYSVPFTGWKASGLGGVEQSDRTLAHYTRLKTGYLTW
jgi:gamma-glutamyl-gamma-aminobutyraldehyde dehydrogenase